MAEDVGGSAQLPELWAGPEVSTPAAWLGEALRVSCSKPWGAGVVVVGISIG